MIKEERLGSHYYLGCDLGKAAVKFTVLIAVEDDFKIVRTDYIYHHGLPLEVFRKWYRDHNVRNFSGMAVTGHYSVNFDDSTIPVFPVDVCQEEALGILIETEGNLNLLNVGAGGYSVLTREKVTKNSNPENSSFRCCFIENDKKA